MNAGHTFRSVTRSAADVRRRLQRGGPQYFDRFPERRTDSGRHGHRQGAPERNADDRLEYRCAARFCRDRPEQVPETRGTRCGGRRQHFDNRLSSRSWSATEPTYALAKPKESPGSRPRLAKCETIRSGTVLPNGRTPFTRIWPAPATFEQPSPQQSCARPANSDRRSSRHRSTTVASHLRAFV